MSAFKQYIGDSVYADFDGERVILTTENGYHDDPRNRIVLEPEVWSSLDRWWQSTLSQLYHGKLNDPD